MNQENHFGSMWLDSHESMQDPNKVSYALNAVRKTYSKNQFGYANELGTELCAQLPSGYKLRGYTHIAERNEFIVFLYNGSNSEIGGVNVDTCTYKKYLNDSQLTCKLKFGFDEWIHIEPKRIQPCNEIELYWSNGRVYKYFNIDSKNTHLIKNCNDIRVFKVHSPPRVTVRTILSGGNGVLNGTYQAVVQLTDENNNHTNWFNISEKTKIWGGDNKPGGTSDQYIEIILEGLPEHYKYVNVAIVKIIDGKTSAHILYNRYPHTQRKKTLEYRGVASEKEDISLSEILKKRDYYINGKGLIQKDNRLILYDVDNHWNLDYQKTANNINVGFAAYRVRASESHNYPTLLGGENYIFGIGWNYYDGTSSAVFPLINKNKVIGTSSSECTECDLGTWEVQDTSTIDWVDDAFVDIYDESNATQKEYKNYSPTREPYKTLDEWGEEAKKEAERDISEVNDIAKDNYDDLDEVLDLAESSGCCDASTIPHRPPGIPIGPCVFKHCPPGARCIDGICYITVFDSVPPDNEHLKPDDKGNPDQHDEVPPVGPIETPEQTGGGGGGSAVGSGGLYDHVPGFHYELSNPLPAGYWQQNRRRGLLMTSCGYGEYCQGCSVCTGGAQVGTRDSNGREITCNGRTTGTGCGWLPYMSVTQREESIKGELDTRSSCTHEYCREGDPPCRYGCPCIYEEDPVSPLRWGFCGGKKDGDSDDGGVTTTDTSDNGIPDEPIYDSDGCTIIGYKPKKFMTGLFGYGESAETYPTTLDCEEKPIYGEYAGKPITLFKVPSRTKIPHFISYTDGVKSIIEPGNDEMTRGYVHVIGLNISNVKFPEETPKPLNSNRPYTIYMIKRDNSNKTILAKGLLCSTFEGKVYGDKMMFPRPGTNGIELFNRYIKDSNRSESPDAMGRSNYEDHAGQLSDKAGYTFHSPTTTAAKPNINGEYLDVELEIYGKGFRHGLYARGDEPSDSKLEKIGGIKQILSKAGTNVPRLGQKGARSVVFLNKAERNEVKNCVLDASYVEADSILKKTAKMSMPYCNKDSEACVYLELKDKMKLKRNIDSMLTDGQYNGTGNVDADGSGDGSCFGDVKYHNTPIYLASAHYGSIKRRNIRQYGRLEKATWITTGLDGVTTSLDGICGDNYISFYSFTKSVYLSDRVGSDVLINDPLHFDQAASSVENAPEEGDGNKGDRAKEGAKGLKKIINNMTGASLAWSLGMCGDPPISGLSVNIDPRAKSGLRYFNPWTGNDDEPLRPWDNIYGGYIEWGIKFPGNFGPMRNIGAEGPVWYRAYYPGIYKQEIIFPVESEVAVNLRQTGEEIDKEIHYFNTKGHTMDSSYSNNNGWRNRYLNMFYIELPEVSFMQKLLITGIIFFVRIIFPLYILLQLGGYIKGGGGIAGSLISVVLQIVILLLVIVMAILLYIALKTFASEYLIQFLGIKQCYSDRLGGPGDGYKKDFHDNYMKYNYDYSRQNTFEWQYGMDSNYNVCKCLAEPSNKILSSNPQIIDSPANSWLQFKISAFLEVGSKYGAVTNMFIRQENLYAHTTEMIYQISLNNKSLNADENSDLTNDYIVAATPIMDGVQEGFAGLRHPNASINTPYGYIWIDDESCRIYSFNGSVEEISNQGIRQFLKENLRLKTLEDNPSFFPVDQKADHGIGYALGYDYKNERMMLTKKDKDSWTLSYSPEEKGWISFHSYTPHLYMYDRFNMYTEHNGSIWKFNSGNHYHVYFNEKYPHIIEFIAISNGFYSGIHKHLELKTEANIYVAPPNLVIRDTNATFNRGLFYNSKQSTGYLNLIQSINGESLLENMIESSKSIRISTQDSVWRISDLKDYTVNTLSPIIYKDYTYRSHPVNENLSSEYKHMFLQDKWIAYQMILDDRHDMELLSFAALTSFAPKKQ